MLRLLIWCTVLVVWMAYVPVGSAASQPALVDQPGVWSLGRLGSGAIDFPLEGIVERRSIPFLLPQHARQGRPRWYLVRLHFTITFANSARAGTVLISALTDGRASAQIEFNVRRRADGGNTIRWRTLDYIRGAQTKATTSRRVEVRFQNYLQFRGVRAGKNSLAIQFERFKGAEVESLRIHRDSGIEVSNTGPARLRVLPEDDIIEVTEGEEFAVRYTITNVGDRPALHVRVAPDFADRFQLLGQRAQNRAVVRESLRGQFRFRARASGVYPLAIFVDSGTNHPGAVVEVRVSRHETLAGMAAGIAPRVTGVVLLALGAVVIWRPRRRQHG
jgi:hypothetical protein